MPPLHIEPLTSTLRWYEDGKQHENWDRWSASAIMQWCGEDEVFILACSQPIKMQFRNELREKMRELGVKTVTYLRRGRKVVHLVDREFDRHMKR